MKKISVLVVLMLIFCAIGASRAFAIEGMITRLAEDGKVVISKGLDANVHPGMDFYVTRMSEPVGKITVVQVDDYNSLCKPLNILPGKHLQVGDVVSTTPYTKPPEKEEEREKTSSEVSNVTDEELLRERQKAREEYEERVKEQYKDVLERKTKILQFRRGSGGTVKINPFDVYNLLSTVVFAGPYSSFNVYHGLSTAYGIYASYESSANPNRIRNVQMEITHWDSEYLDSFAAYYGYKESVSDPRKVSVIKQNIYRQKGLDKFYVFQVKIINPGPGAFQLAPFPWHFYLKGTDGSRIKADHYDQILDKALNPNQVVNGYIYFKKDTPNAPSGSDLTVILADILGNNREVSFK